jgi:1-acyl-sn-glycerol-3-phosphate acyltransferase
MLRRLWVSAVLVALTPPLSLAAILGCLVAPRSFEPFNRAARLWSRALLAAAGVRVRYHGLDRAKPGPARIFACNHQSAVDIWALLVAVPLTTRFVAKQELFDIPFLGWALRAGGFVPIARGDHNRALHDLRVAASRIQRGCSVVLFPEGKRSSDGRLRAFKKGAFHLALEAHVPVVPVAIVGTAALHPPGFGAARSGSVDVHFEAPVEVERFLPRDTEGLRDEVRAAIAARLGEALSADEAARAGAR